MSELNKILNNRVVTTGKTIFPVKSSAEQKQEAGKSNFEDLLRQKLTGELKFSKHAEARLRSRNIHIDAEQKQRITDAVAKAEQKGVKESLVLMDDLAFVVSVKNKTVITAVNNDDLKESVFTNIDGAVII
ncbi:TIGR02530 family flagellar biosynthesis protein [Petroclostridium sp. X23]|jgi:flagellar operon protein|uniref:TIGR02530 family flagellar biosynthesis protein n=1 Tax=Petroclostridium sp. X23 TaxID=3045146 RepID=UPI0024AE2110|nr:TIGR02530 family flagellar biosynthesis protein [Petroclostridium sp. X23]WHH58938.1 TIGR02530 family flagellar biosynthesis protein [Petroclostridium sp. X23]